VTVELVLGDMWSIRADAYCIPTNSTLNGRGRAVMGAGVAKDARDRFPGADSYLGLALAANGHCTQVIGEFVSFASKLMPVVLVSFPTKTDWWKPSTAELIAKSAVELMDLVDREGWERVLLPKPGCGKGGLNWEYQVRPILEDILDARVTVVGLP
jgi:O-acetyl-ADP-ribose deacetylase (regulator of RNase III)